MPTALSSGSSIAILRTVIVVSVIRQPTDYKGIFIATGLCALPAGGSLGGYAKRLSGSYRRHAFRV
jgi:hypothetical protein